MNMPVARQQNDRRSIGEQPNQVRAFAVIPAQDFLDGVARQCKKPIRMMLIVPVFARHRVALTVDNPGSCMLAAHLGNAGLAGAGIDLQQAIRDDCPAFPVGFHDHNIRLCGVRCHEICERRAGLGGTRHRPMSKRRFIRVASCRTQLVGRQHAAYSAAHIMSNRSEVLARHLCTGRRFAGFTQDDQQGLIVMPG